MPQFVTVSKGLSDGIDTPDRASDGGGETTSNLDTSPREANSEGTPIAKRTVGSVEVDATEESCGGPSETSADTGRRGNEHPTSGSGVYSVVDAYTSSVNEADSAPLRLKSKSSLIAHPA